MLVAVAYNARFNLVPAPPESSDSAMIEANQMTARQNVHQLVDILPEGSLDDVIDYLASFSEPDEPLSPEVLAPVEEGREDLRNRRTVTLEEFARKHRL